MFQERFEAEMKVFCRQLPPKKPSNSYIEFCKVEKPKVLAELGPLSILEVGKELGRRWQSLPQIEKEFFIDIQKKNKDQYLNDLAAFLKEASVISPEVPSSSKDSALIPTVTPSSSRESSELVEIDVAAQDIVDSAPHINVPPEASSAHINSDPTAKPDHATKPDAATYCEPTSNPESPTNPDPPSNFEPAILSSDLGFAKQRFYPWHPALKIAVLAKGSRISVTYFGTGESGTVDKAKWAPFSDKSEARICSPYLLRKTSFKRGLEQLKAMLVKIKSDGERVPNSSGVGFAEQPVGRKLVKLSKEGLMRDEEQNLKFMREKIVESKDKQYKWACRDCAWKGKYAVKAKIHARDCGTRRRENIRKPKMNKFECSGDGCNLAFPYLNQLQKHYR